MYIYKTNNLLALLLLLLVLLLFEPEQVQVAAHEHQPLKVDAVEAGPLGLEDIAARREQFLHCRRAGQGSVVPNHRTI